MTFWNILPENKTLHFNPKKENAHQIINKLENKSLLKLIPPNKICSIWHSSFYIPPHYSGKVLWLHIPMCPSVCPSTGLSIRLSYVHLSIFFSRQQLEYISVDFCQTWYALILWRPILGLLMGKFINFWQLSGHLMSVFSFPDNNLSKYQWICTKLGICFDIMENWFGIANGQICQFLTELSACHMSVFSFSEDYLSKYQWMFTKHGICTLIFCRSVLRLLMGKFHQILTVISP